MLHIITASPYKNSALRECLSIAAEDDVLVLIGDAVYAAKNDAESFVPFKVFALTAHLMARGIHTPPWLQGIDFDQFVDLTCQHHPVQTWS